MFQTRKIGAKHYYEYLPDLSHRCGDIWSGLPTHGLLGSASCRGLVITPACDLANRKAETIIYLPIIPLRAYFGTTGALPEIKDRMTGLLRAGKFDPSIDWAPGRYRPPIVAEVDRVEAAIAGHLAAKQRGEKEIVALQRVKAGLSVLRIIAKGQLAQPESEHLRIFFGSEWGELKSKIISNSFRTDLHFLPKDEQEGGFMGLAAHSVVLFRYPLTAPIEVLELAQNTPENSWKIVCSSLSQAYPAASGFSAERPVKVLSLKSEFLADLLSRYCGVYSRLGSPDFTPGSVTRIAEEVDA